MTVETTIQRQYFDGDGLNKNFPFNFKFFDNSTIYVATIDSDGDVTGLTEGIDYTLTGASSKSGGKVVTTAAPGFGFQLMIERVLPDIQSTSFRNQGAFFPAIHEDTFDKIVMLIQQALAGVANSLQTDRSGRFWDFKGKRGINAADPVNPQDVATKNWVGSFVDSVSGLINTTLGIAYDAGTLFDYLRYGVNRSVDTIALLRTLSAARNQRAFVFGYYAKGDGGGGEYYIDTTDTTSADNGGTIIVAADGARWKLANNSIVSILQFGARGTGTGVTGVGADDTVPIQAAFTWAQSVHATLRVPSLKQGFVFRVTATLLIPKGFTLIGDGVAVFDNPLSTTTINTRGPGSWIHFDHAGKGIYFGDTISRRGAVIDGLAFMRNQPTPIVGGVFTPAANDFDIDIRDFDDIDIKNTMLLNPTKAINNFGGVRLLLDNIKGQPLQLGVVMDAVFDVCRFSKVHWWPFWTNIDSTEIYCSINLSQFQFGRADNCMVDSCFGIFSRRQFNIVQSAFGPCNKLRISNCDADSSASMVTISANAATICINNCVQQNSGRTAVRTAIGPGGAGIEWVGGNDGRMQFSNISVQGSGGSCISMYNGINRIQGVDLEIGSWGQISAGAFGIDIQGNGNIFELANPPRVVATIGGAGAVIGGAGAPVAEINIPLSSGSVQGLNTDASGYLTVPIPDRGTPPRKFIATSQGAALHHVSLTSVGQTTVQVRIFDQAGAPYASSSVYFNWMASY